MPARRLDRLERDVGGRLRERREDAAAVEPARAVDAEDPLPVDVAGTQLRGGGVPAVGDADRAAHAEPALGEVEPVPHLPADAVVRGPDHMRTLDAALVDQVLDQAADRVVGERRDDGRPEPEAPLEAAGDVVLAAPFPGTERARRRDPLLARVEPEHHLAERDEIEAALLGRPERQQSAHRPLTARASRSISSNRPSRISSGRTIQLPPQATTDGTAR